ncbi:RagB/SusD family nutrient uptake outer membrane protein [Gemmatimonas groenlandica]|uniref:RagB/SusD family nutrient uptake outer membrane protein n=1 Tax=Gemmatimonas groenlandica TaxID=2732249 RepID=A0A6M4ISQ1_9BACT|nr:RagB/SusD family nutrient uptake outer membrane protein [Gemmatimonas groenlandica]QJR35271.1 RagB/SusD family nutrient uptake outer membrane protein [Gemmatimonas groenlandica]
MTTSRAFATLGAALVLGACSADKLDITNPNTPSVAAASGDPQALQLQATGLLRQLRGGRGGFISNTGIFGRESYNYTPQEGRNTSNYLIGISGQNRLDPAGFATGVWAGQYGNLRDVFNLKNVATTSTALTAEQKAATLGFAKTIEGLELLYVISTRDTLGAIVEIKANASELAAFVSRDSVYKYILATLDEGATNLAAGGSAFPFTIHAGFNGFNTPSTFRLFNRAIAARAAAYYATSGGGAAAWQRALTALGASFINTAATTRAQLDAGPAHVYSSATGDANNPLNVVTATDIYAHESIRTDAQNKANGSPDDRYTAKIGSRPTRNAPSGLGIASSLGFNVYPALTSNIPIIRNEELLLLRAEALLATADKAGAIAIVNQLRVNSGGLAPSTLTTASTDADVLTEILYNKRYSLLLEGHRWIDMRRYGRLNQLPLDIATGTNAHFVARVMPIPQGECLVRVGKPAPLAGPGC